LLCAPATAMVGGKTEYHADRIRPLLHAYNDLLAVM
jgi:hypothetical protein